jgi:hypothetical protein
MKVRFTVWLVSKPPVDDCTVVPPYAPNGETYGCSMVLNEVNNIRGNLVYKWVYEADDYNLFRHQLYHRCKRWHEYTNDRVVVGEWGK